MVTRYLGTCPVCEGDYRLHKMRMVHHGYKRPGTGSIHGDCPGVGYLPYEISTEGTEHYAAGLGRTREVRQAALDRLQSGTVTKLSKVLNPRDRYAPPRFKELTPADGYEFRRELEDRIRDLEYEIKGIDRELERCDRLISTWVERPVRTEEEDVARRAEASAARRAALDEARAARQSKRDVISAKNAERAAEKAALIQEYRDIFNELAFRAGEPGVHREAMGHWQKMQRRKRKKAYLNFREHEMGIDEALEALKLAKRWIRDPNRFAYADDYGLEPRVY
jgi:hypothetical protein